MMMMLRMRFAPRPASTGSRRGAIAAAYADVRMHHALDAQGRLATPAAYGSLNVWMLRTTQISPPPEEV